MESKLITASAAKQSTSPARFCISNWRSTGPEQLFRRTCLSSILIACLQNAYANPAMPQVVYGQAHFATQGKQLTITNTPNTIIDWQSFSIQAGETTRFVQQNANSSVLNRIQGQNPSHILGNLQSNGRVFLINPNGILFAQSARVDVQALVASSLPISQQDFLSGKQKFGDASQPSSSAGKVSNAGQINTGHGGQVFLIAPQVENSGIINSAQGEIFLAAGRAVQLVDAANPDLHVVLSAPADQAINLGQIVAQAGKVGIYAALIKQRGRVQADSASLNQQGKVVFKASRETELSRASVTSASNQLGMGGKVEVSAPRVSMLDQSQINVDGHLGGGSILLGGDLQGKNPQFANAIQTYVGPNASLSANASMAGDGGRIIAWADQTTQFYGSAQAQGAGALGNGGLIETSGKQILDVAGARIQANAGAASLGQRGQGKNGRWLLDPADITVTHGSATPPISEFFAPPQSSSVTDGQINAVLKQGTDVTLYTGNGDGGTGLVRFNGTADPGGAATIVNEGGKRSLEVITDGKIEVRAGASFYGDLSNPLSVKFNTYAGSIDFAGILNSPGELEFIGPSTFSGSIKDANFKSIQLVTGAAGMLDGVTLPEGLSTTGEFFFKNGLKIGAGRYLQADKSLLQFGNGSQTISSSGYGGIDLKDSEIRIGWDAPMQTLTLGEGLFLYGDGKLSSATPSSLVNQGEISTYGPNPLTISTTHFEQAGILNAFGPLNLSPTTWNNTGEVRILDGSANFNFNTSTQALGKIVHEGGELNWGGVLDNTGHTLNIGEYGDFGYLGLNKLTGTIKNGSLTSSSELPLNSMGGTLDGVKITDTLALTGSVNIHNNLSLAKSANFKLGDASLNFIDAGTQRIQSDGYANIEMAGAKINLGVGVTGQTLEFDGFFSFNGHGTIAQSMPANLVNNGEIRFSDGNAVSIDVNHFHNKYFISNESQGNLQIKADQFVNSDMMFNFGKMDLHVNAKTTELGYIVDLSGGLGWHGRLDNTGNALDIKQLGQSQQDLNIRSTVYGSIVGGSIVDGDFSPQNDRSLQLSGGSLEGVSINGVLNLKGHGEFKNGLHLADAAQLDLGQGTWKISGNGTQHISSDGLATLKLAGGKLEANTASQILQLDAGITLHGFGSLTQSANATLSNLGTIHANQSGKTLSIALDQIQNSGTILASDGNLAIHGTTSLKNSGSIAAQAGLTTLQTQQWSNSGVLKTSGSGKLALNFDTSSAALGSFQRDGGTVSLGGVLDNTGHQLDLSTAFGVGGLDFSSGTIKGGNILNSANTAFVGSGGTLDGVTISGNLSLSGEHFIRNGLSLENAANLNLGNSSLRIRDGGNQHLTSTGSATIQLAGGEIVAGYQSSGQSLLIDSGITLHGYGSLLQNNSAYIVNLGTIDANVAGKNLLLSADTVSNQGTLRVSTGNLQISGMSGNDGKIQIAEGNSLSFPGNFDNHATGIIEGNGSFVLNGGAGNLNNAGSLRPGGSGSVGKLTLHGNLVQASSGKVEVEVGPSAINYDRLSLTGSASLDGHLQVSTLDNFVPSNSDQFTFLTYQGKANGNFASVSAPAFSGTSTDTNIASMFLFKMPNSLLNIWNADASGDWSDASKWSLGHVPTTNEDVHFPDYASQYSVTLSAAGQQAKSIVLLGNDSFTMTGGTLSVANSSLMTSGSLYLFNDAVYHANGEMRLHSLALTDSASLNLAAGKNLSTNLYTQAGGSLNSGAAAQLSVNQSFARSAGSISTNFSNLNINHASGNLRPGALTSTGNLALTALQGDIELTTTLNAGSRVTLATPNGGIARVHFNGDLDVAAPQLVVNSKTGLGSSHGLAFQVSQLQVNNTGSGEVRAHFNNKNLQISDISNTGFGVQNLGSGGIILSSIDTLVVDAPINSVNGDTTISAQSINFSNHNAAK